MKKINWAAAYTMHVGASGVSLFAIPFSMKAFFLVFFFANLLVGVFVGLLYFMNESEKKPGL